MSMSPAFLSQLPYAKGSKHLQCNNVHQTHLEDVCMFLIYLSLRSIHVLISFTLVSWHSFDFPAMYPALHCCCHFVWCVECFYCTVSLNDTLDTSLVHTSGPTVGQSGNISDFQRKCMVLLALYLFMYYCIFRYWDTGSNGVLYVGITRNKAILI